MKNKRDKVVTKKANTTGKLSYKHIQAWTQFCEAVLQAALESIHVTFIGPKGSATRLERSALAIDDLRMRPDVLWNFMTLRQHLRGGTTPPPPIHYVVYIFIYLYIYACICICEYHKMSIQLAPVCNVCRANLSK